MKKYLDIFYEITFYSFITFIALGYIIIIIFNFTGNTAIISVVNKSFMLDLVGGLLVTAIIIFWLGMFYDLYHQDFDDKATKSAWFFVLLFGIFFGAFIYYFLIYKK